MDRSRFCEPHFAVKARVSPLGSPSVMNMLAPLVRRMFAIAYGENEFTLLQMKGIANEGFGSGDGTGPAEESKRTKRVQGWSRQIGLGTLFAIRKLFSIYRIFATIRRT